MNNSPLVILFCSCKVLNSLWKEAVEWEITQLYHQSFIIELLTICLSTFKWHTYIIREYISVTTLQYFIITFYLKLHIYFYLMSLYKTIKASLLWIKSIRKDWLKLSWRLSLYLYFVLRYNILCMVSLTDLLMKGLHARFTIPVIPLIFFESNEEDLVVLFF